MKKGAVKDIKDKKDYQWSRVPKASSFDWTTGYDIELELRKILKNTVFTLPTKDQDGSYSCGGQAWAYYGSVLEAVTTGTFEEVSAKFHYAQCYAPGGGSMGKPLCELSKNQGFALESALTSYDKGKPPTEAFMTRTGDITTDIRNKASYSKALVYAQVPADIDIIANALKNNYGVCIALNGEDNGTWLSEFPSPPSKQVWAHWLYVGKARLMNGKKYLGVKNSWGNIGDNGWQWIGEDYFKTKNVWYGWTMTFDKPNLVAKLKGERLSLMKQLLNLIKEQLAKML